MNNTRKEDWLHMYVSGCTIYYNSVHISLLPKFFLWETNGKNACHKCLINSSRGSITAVTTVYCAFLCAMELDVNKELISTRQNHRFLSNNYTSQQMNRNEFLKTIRLTSFQKPTITTKTRQFSPQIAQAIEAGKNKAKNQQCNNCRSWQNHAKYAELSRL